MDGWLTPKMPPNPPRTTLLSLLSSSMTGATGAGVGRRDVVVVGRNVAGACVGGMNGDPAGNAGASVGLASGSGSGSGTGWGSGSGSGTDSGSDVVSGSGSGWGSGAGSGAGSGSGSGWGSGWGSDADSGAVSISGLTSGCGSGSGSAAGSDSVAGTGSGSGSGEASSSWEPNSVTGSMVSSTGSSTSTELKEISPDVDGVVVVASTLSSDSVVSTKERLGVSSVVDGAVGGAEEEDSRAGVEVTVVEVVTSGSGTMLPSSVDGLTVVEAGTRPGLRMFPTTSSSSTFCGTFCGTVAVGVRTDAVGSVGKMMGDCGRLTMEASLGLNRNVGPALMTLVVTIELSPSMEAIVCGGTCVIQSINSLQFS